jgi:Sulfatase
MVTNLKIDRYALRANSAVLQLGTALLLCLLAAVTTNAQQINGVPGSPGATVTIDGKQLLPPPMPFGGTIKESAKDSTPWWPPRVVPPKGAPNILLIMTDDQGYGVSGTFGGVIPTPALDRIAKAGLRYTQFHSTALCSPTRAALITGRNHHSVGYGVIGEMSTGYPGCDSISDLCRSPVGGAYRHVYEPTEWPPRWADTNLLGRSSSGAVLRAIRTWQGQFNRGENCSLLPRRFQMPFL